MPEMRIGMRSCESSNRSIGSDYFAIRVQENSVKE